jgi:hypothetical protein
MSSRRDWSRVDDVPPLAHGSAPGALQRAILRGKSKRRLNGRLDWLLAPLYAQVVSIFDFTTRVSLIIERIIHLIIERVIREINLADISKSRKIAGS